MKLSTDRILTTHVGSLPRSQAVTDVVFGKEKSEAPDFDAAGSATLAAEVTEVVKRQVAAGVDVVSDGELSNIS
jgi:5-methyltetrahydropteroyltriglutamate--homocysteine methyltransferase